MAKVYCKGCVFLKKKRVSDYDGGYWVKDCFHSDCFVGEVAEVDTPMRPIVKDNTERVAGKEDLNQDNNCLNFERKKKWYEKFIKKSDKEEDKITQVVEDDIEKPRELTTILIGDQEPSGNGNGNGNQYNTQALKDAIEEYQPGVTEHLHLTEGDRQRGMERLFGNPQEDAQQRAGDFARGALMETSLVVGRNNFSLELSPDFFRNYPYPQVGEEEEKTEVVEEKEDEPEIKDKSSYFKNIDLE